MPLFSLRLTMTRTAGDDVVWSYGVDGPEPTGGILGALIDRYQTAWTGETSNMRLGQLSWTLLEAFPAEGGPAVAVRAVSPNYTIGLIGQALPPQCAVVVSDLVEGTRGVGPRGRTFYGPLRNSGITSPNDPLVDEDRREAFSRFALAWHAGMVAEGYTPVVISRQNAGTVRPTPVGLPIVGYRIDNVFDTQRRRSPDPSAATSVDVPV